MLDLRPVRTMIITVVVCGLVAVTGCSPNDAGDDDGGAPTATRTADTDQRTDREVRAGVIMSGLTSPWGLVPLADGTVLISERNTGQILRVDSGQKTLLATLPDVHHEGEDGLLGLVLTPDKTALLAYLSTDQDNRIVSMSWDGSELGDPSVILSGLARASNHDGGRMIFGPDGYLYVGTGDAAQRELAQDPKSLNGKVLRLTADGKPAPDNPFDNEVWSLGHRNVQGLAFDDRGRLWESEFGENTWDELNLITRGANYGWPESEGTEDSSAEFTAPAVVWATDDASPSGLAYWRDSLWMASLRGNRLWQIPLDERRADEPNGGAGQPSAHLTETFGRLRTVVTSADRRALLLITSNTDGRGDPAGDDDKLIKLSPP